MRPQKLSFAVLSCPVLCICTKQVLKLLWRAVGPWDACMMHVLQSSRPNPSLPSSSPIVATGYCVHTGAYRIYSEMRIAHATASSAGSDSDSHGRRGDGDYDHACSMQAGDRADD